MEPIGISFTQNIEKENVWLNENVYLPIWICTQWLFQLFLKGIREVLTSSARWFSYMYLINKSIVWKCYSISHPLSNCLNPFLLTKSEIMMQQYYRIWCILSLRNMLYSLAFDIHSNLSRVSVRNVTVSLALHLTLWRWQHIKLVQSARKYIV